MENKFEESMNKYVDLFMNAKHKDSILKGRTENEYREYFIQDTVNGMIPIIEYRFAEYLGGVVTGGDKFKGFRDFLDKKAEKGNECSVLDFYDFLQKDTQEDIKKRIFND